jgi:hypothetical protein
VTQNRIHNYRAIDPSILQAMQAYTLGGASPFYGQQDLSGYGWPGPPEDTDELGTLDYQNDAFTAIKKGQGLAMDPSFILSLGTGMGGYSPQAYDPVQQYQPVEAGGYMRAIQAAQGTDPLQKLIATRALEGASALAIESEINRMVMNPQNDDEATHGQLLRASIPPWYDYETGTPKTDLQGNPVPDFQAVRSQISSLTDSLASDSPMWDGQTFDPRTGMPAIMYEAPSEAQQALDRGGYTHNPYETYDPDLFAAPGALEQEQQWMQGHEGATRRYSSSQNIAAQMRALLENQQRDPAEFLAPPAGALQSQPQASGPAELGDMQPLGPEWGARNDRNRRGSPAPAPGPQMMALPVEQIGRNIRPGRRGTPEPQMVPVGVGSPQGVAGRPQSSVFADSIAQQQNRTREAMIRRQMHAAGMQQNQAKDGLIQAAYERAMAQRGQGQRQQYVQDLAAQGHTPWNAQHSSRMASLWGR